MIAAYKNLTDEELLLSLSDKRHHSPLIDELCTRLEASIDNAMGSDIELDCPVCLASLKTHIKSENDLVLTVNS